VKLSVILCEMQIIYWIDLFRIAVNCDAFVFLIALIISCCVPLKAYRFDFTKQ